MDTIAVSQIRGRLQMWPWSEFFHCWATKDPMGRIRLSKPIPGFIAPRWQNMAANTGDGNISCVPLPGCGQRGWLRWVVFVGGVDRKGRKEMRRCLAAELPLHTERGSTPSSHSESWNRLGGRGCFVVHQEWECAFEGAFGMGQPSRATVEVGLQMWPPRTATPEWVGTKLESQGVHLVKW